jgi:CRISPR-associated endonuclease/helicase Cas3
MTIVAKQELQAIAHVDPAQLQRVHLLPDHLSAVAQMAEEMSAEFGAAEWGRLAGRWHDLGKYSEEFKKYIRAASGYEAELATGAAGRVDHSTAGALCARRELGAMGRPLEYLIAGHHAGLPDWHAEEHGNACLESRLREGGDKGLLDKVLGQIPETMLAVERPGFVPASFGGADGLHLWIRMLFSCLVDADYLDTESFMDEGKSQQRGQYPGLDVLLAQFNRSMQARFLKPTAPDKGPSPINRIRASVLRQCRDKARGEPGFYTLTVPTGGGKTLSSLAFALEHAVHHGKRRVIYGIPYTSIIEQSADAFRDIFGDAVLEHHCNLDVSHESMRTKLAAENWDAPLIVTTNVQLFESLFSARTSRCRKLHNLVNSVIILDEAQLLPPEFLQPILAAMRLLVAHYGATFVLCTATQPALQTRSDTHGRTILLGIDAATEIMDDVSGMFEQLDRVRVIQPEALNEQGDWDEIAAKIARHASVLAIVNTRNDCRELHRRMPRGTIHLSALMCGEHRSYVIGEIKRKLRCGEPVRVISTQLIEAGVDIDFPVVFRALAGLDSIAQAAGRCNREGKIAGRGELFVFVPPKQSPLGLLRYGEDACRSILQERPGPLLEPSLFSRYFEQYYSRVGRGGLDKHGIVQLLTGDAREGNIQFRTAAERFQLIDEGGRVSIIVPYANPEGPTHDSRALVGQLRAGATYRDLLRRLQRYCVTVNPHDFAALQKSGDLEEVLPERWALRNETAYSHSLGLLVGEGANPDPSQLAV